MANIESLSLNKKVIVSPPKELGISKIEALGSYCYALLLALSEVPVNGDNKQDSEQYTLSQLAQDIEDVYAISMGVKTPRVDNLLTRRKLVDEPEMNNKTIANSIVGEIIQRVQHEYDLRKTG